MPLPIQSAPSPNFNDRAAPVDVLMLHYTGMVDGPSAIARLRDPESNVSAHYVVGEDGTILSLVPEGKRAWHAGKGWWRGDTDLNSRSIGIEIVNGGHDFGLPPFPEIQIDAVIALCRDILGRWAIPANRVVGHSDVAPDRKADPGELFPWRRLSESGVGFWPSDAALAAAPSAGGDMLLRRHLRQIGYAIDEVGPEAAITAFQRRWLPTMISGTADPMTIRMAAAVAALSGDPDAREGA